MFDQKNIHRITAGYQPENLKSAMALERLGLINEELTKNYLRINGQWKDSIDSTYHFMDTEAPFKKIC